MMEEMRNTARTIQLVVWSLRARFLELGNTVHPAAAAMSGALGLGFPNYFQINENNA